MTTGRINQVTTLVYDTCSEHESRVQLSAKFYIDDRTLSIVHWNKIRGNKLWLWRVFMQIEYWKYDSNDNYSNEI